MNDVWGLLTFKFVKRIYDDVVDDDDDDGNVVVNV